MDRLVIWALRVALVILLLVSVLVQVVVPILASDFGHRNPEVEHLVVPYSMAAILFVGCGQLALLAIWRLLSMVAGGAIFTERALRWVDVIVACGAVATVLCGAVLLHVYAFAPGHGGPTVFWIAGVLVAGVMFLLLMVVMKGMLEAAVADRAELDGVI
jgi:hypothetical protein